MGEAATGGSSMRSVSRSVADLACFMALFALGCLWSWWFSGEWPEFLNLRGKNSNDCWFDADAVRVYQNLVDVGSNHYRTNVHPLFSLLGHTLVRLARSWADSPWSAVRQVLAMVAGVVLAGTYAVCRMRALTRIDAALAALLLASSGAFIFWSGVPETYVFGAATIIAVLAFAARQDDRLAPDWAYVLIMVLALSTTTTNVVFGLLVVWIYRRSWHGLRLVEHAFVLAVALWLLQKLIFPTAGFFLGDREELLYLRQFSPPSILAAFRAMLFHGMVVPEFSTIPAGVLRTPPALYLGSPEIDWKFPSILAVACWGALIAGIFWQLRTVWANDRFVRLLVLAILFQIALHSVYGAETFLYSLHYVPALALLAAICCLRGGRLEVRLIFCALIGLNLANNLELVSRALATYSYLSAP